MEKAAEKMRLEAPLLWKMVNNLLDASPRKRRVENKINVEPGVTASVEDAALHRLGNNNEGDLGEIGGDNQGEDHDDDGMDIDSEGSVIMMDKDTDSDESDEMDVEETQL